MLPNAKVIIFLPMLVTYFANMVMGDLINAGLVVSTAAYQDTKMIKCVDYRGYWPVGAT